MGTHLNGQSLSRDGFDVRMTSRTAPSAAMGINPPNNCTVQILRIVSIVLGEQCIGCRTKKSGTAFIQGSIALPVTHYFFPTVLVAFMFN